MPANTSGRAKQPAGVLIAAPASGSGKTLMTLGLLRALTNRGVSVASAKVGPDYIDPAFHAVASRRACINIDPWAMRTELRAGLLADLPDEPTMIVCEGVMGLFDGATATQGSSADIAAETGWPVVLVIDARAQAASAAAVVRGFASHRDDVAIAGVIFNRVGSARHRAVIAEAMAATLPDIDILGFVPRSGALELPSRHLGLVQAVEHPQLENFIDAAAGLIEEHVNIHALQGLSRPSNMGGAGAQLGAIPPLGQRIAVASDEAFAFRYGHVIAGWRAAGADVQMFSPLHNEAPSVDADAIYLPGGYPELHAGKLSAANLFLNGMRDAAARGTVVFAECGGYMVLGEGLVDGDGARHAMAGLLPLETSFAKRALHLGYRRACCASDGPLGVTGTPYRGHEFHYATVIKEGPAEPLFEISDATQAPLGTAGLRHGNIAGSFIHLIDREDGA